MPYFARFLENASPRPHRRRLVQHTDADGLTTWMRVKVSDKPERWQQLGYPSEAAYRKQAA